MVAPNPNFSASILVLDASVTINLLGSNKGASILQAINADILIEDTTLFEIKKTKYSIDDELNSLDGLIKHENLKPTVMPNEYEHIFWDLVTAKSPDDLDDGEAAAIALAVSLSAGIALDDRKARRIINQIFPNVPVMSSLELFTLPAVQAHLGSEQQYEAIYNALVNTRMRVLQDHDEWVRNILGPERILNCPSLKHRDVGTTFQS